MISPSDPSTPPAQLPEGARDSLRLDPSCRPELPPVGEDDRLDPVLELEEQLDRWADRDRKARGDP